MTNRTLKKHLEYKLPQIRLAIIRDRVCEAIPIMTPNDLEQFLEPLKHFSEEYFIAYHLDARHHVVAYHEVSHGTTSASLVHPREVFNTTPTILPTSSRVLSSLNVCAASRFSVTPVGWRWRRTGAIYICDGVRLTDRYIIVDSIAARTAHSEVPLPVVANRTAEF